MDPNCLNEHLSETKSNTDIGFNSIVCRVVDNLRSGNRFQSGLERALDEDSDSKRKMYRSGPIAPLPSRFKFKVFVASGGEHRERAYVFTRRTHLAKARGRRIQYLDTYIYIYT